jgi:hypothetical protein
LAQTLASIADQVAKMPGMSDSAKNQILGEIGQILSQLQQGSVQGPQSGGDA